MIRAGRGGLIAAALALILIFAPSTSARALDPVPDLGGRAMATVVAPASVVPAAPAVASAASAGPFARIASLPYAGGAVLHSNRTHVIFWTPDGSGLSFPSGYETLVEQFLAGVAHDSHLPTNVYSLSGQYYDSTGPAVYDSTYGGALVDTAPLPASGCQEPAVGGPGWGLCVTDAQLQAELERFTAAQNLPHTSRDIYFIVTPDGLGSCEFTGPENCALGGTTAGSYCGYHSVTTDGALLYAVIPYNAVPGHCQSDGNPRPNGNPADPTLSTISHEHNETVTDPFGDAWVDASGNEEADLCIRTYGANLGGSGASAYNEVIDGGHYYLQAEYSDWTRSCAARATPDRLSFSASARPVAGRRVTFTAHGQAAFGRISSYAWTFGARSVGRGAGPRHVFTRSGRYLIGVRSTDSAGLWTFASRTITVAAAPRRGTVKRLR